MPLAYSASSHISPDSPGERQGDILTGHLDHVVAAFIGVGGGACRCEGMAEQLARIVAVIDRGIIEPGERRCILLRAREARLQDILPTLSEPYDATC